MSLKRQQMPLVCHGHSRPIVDLQFRYEPFSSRDHFVSLPASTTILLEIRSTAIHVFPVLFFSYWSCTHRNRSNITPDGYFLTSASKDGLPMLRNGETGDWIGTFQGHKGAVWTCTLNDPAFVAATASADFTARVWNAISGDEVLQLPHRHIVRSVDFERGDSAKRVVTGGAEKIVRVYDLERADAPPFEFGGAADGIRCARWVKGTELLLVSYLDARNVDVWDVRGGSVVRTLNSDGPVTSIEIVEGGGTGGGSLCMVTADGVGVSFRDAATFDMIRHHRIKGYEVKSASYNPENKKFVAGGSDMWVHLYDVESGQEIDCGRGHHGPVHCVRFAPGGATYASGSEDGTIRIWKTDPTASGSGDTTDASVEKSIDSTAENAVMTVSSVGNGQLNGSS